MGTHFPVKDTVSIHQVSDPDKVKFIYVVIIRHWLMSGPVLSVRDTAVEFMVLVLLEFKSRQTEQSWNKQLQVQGRERAQWARGKTGRRSKP